MLRQLLEREPSKKEPKSFPGLMEKVKLDPVVETPAKKGRGKAEPTSAPAPAPAPKEETNAGKKTGKKRQVI